MNIFQMVYAYMEKSFFNDEYSISQMWSFIETAIYYKLNYNFQFVDPDKLVHHLIFRIQHGERIVDYFLEHDSKKLNEFGRYGIQAKKLIEKYKIQIRDEQDRAEFNQLLNKIFGYSYNAFDAFDLDEREIEFLKKQHGLIKLLDTEGLLYNLDNHTDDGEPFKRWAFVFRRIYDDEMPLDEEERAIINNWIETLDKMKISDCFVARNRDELVEILRVICKKEEGK